MHLLPREALIATGPVDHADWNYRPVLGWIQRLRFGLVSRLLPRQKVGRLLEIGYGSGVFMPELARRCEELHGIDIHPRAAKVETCLREHGVAARLVSGSAESLPYENGMFDAAVAVSCLEFVPDAVKGAAEIRRVLKPGGCLVFVTPGKSPVVDWGLKVLTGESAQQDYGERRERLMPAMLEQFVIEDRRVFPPVVSGVVCLYSAFRMRGK